MKSEMRDKCLTLLFVLLTCSMSVMAQDEQPAPQRQLDSMEVSLLTCTPGPVAYSMYGHSALRVHNYTTDLDVVFNYGVFDYSEDNFVMKFVKGETDYILGAEYAVGFFGRYRDEGAGILEQVLNFSQE